MQPAIDATQTIQMQSLMQSTTKTFILESIFVIVTFVHIHSQTTKNSKNMSQQNCLQRTIQGLFKLKSEWVTKTKRIYS